nr:glycosyltransferase family 47 protein [Acidobacteriota bacterium]
GVEIEPQHHSRARAQALYILSRSADVQTNIIVRDGWFNRAFENGGVNVPLVRQSRAEFYENMFGSDYVLCARGMGNYSIRFYETLCSGRIPVFVNTDCVLPFEEWVDWRQYCVWVEEEELPHIAERVAEFHERLSPAEFQDLQMACRRLWEEWLSPYGFFKNFHRHFRAEGAR